MRPPGPPGPRTGRGTTAERRHTPRRVAETCQTFCQCGRPSDRWLSLGQVGASGAPPVYRGRTPLKRGHFAVSPAVLTAINKQKKSARREAAGREWARLSVVLLSLPPSGPSHGTVVLPASSACSGRWSACRSVFLSRRSPVTPSFGFEMTCQFWLAVVGSYCGRVSEVTACVSDTSR